MTIFSDMLREAMMTKGRLYIPSAAGGITISGSLAPAFREDSLGSPRSKDTELLVLGFENPVQISR